MSDIFGVIKNGDKSIYGLRGGSMSTTLGIVKGGKKYVIGISPNVPDGRTVTPINDVTIWQQCAGIANPTYTTLAEVLADTGILQTLMASDNAVDYLVRCKSFIGNLALVPKMTSNTTPSGVVSASTIYGSTRDSFYAFDKDNGTYWAGTSNVNEWIQYDFGSPRNVDSVTVKAVYNTTVRLKNFKIQGSNDDVTFTDIYTGVYPSDNSEPEVTYTIVNSVAYRYWRLYAIDNYGGNVIAIITIQYSYSAICQNSNAMTYIGQNNYASNTLLADSDWRNAINISAYKTSILNFGNPIMTGNNSPTGYVASANSVYENLPNWQPYLAFDGDPSSAWLSDVTSPVYLELELPKSIKFYSYNFSIWWYSYSGPATVIIQGSLDNSIWVDLQTVTIDSGGSKTGILENVGTAYRYIRIYSSGKLTYRNDNFVAFYMAKFYGREDV